MSSENIIQLFFDENKNNEDFSLESLEFYLSKLDISAQRVTMGIDGIGTVESSMFSELVLTANQYCIENKNLNFQYLTLPENVYAFYYENVISYTVFYRDKASVFHCFVNPDVVVGFCNMGCTVIEVFSDLIKTYLRESQKYIDKEIDSEKKEEEIKFISDILTLLKDTENSASHHPALDDLKKNQEKEALKGIFLIVGIPLLIVIIGFLLINFF